MYGFFDECLDDDFSGYGDELSPYSPLRLGSLSCRPGAGSEPEWRAGRTVAGGWVMEVEEEAWSEASPPTNQGKVPWECEKKGTGFDELR